MISWLKKKINQAIAAQVRRQLDAGLSHESKDSETGQRVGRQSIMMHAFEWVAKSDLNGSFMEFGCYEGGSFINAYHAYEYWLQKSHLKGWKMTRQPMYAFDSFEGLPALDMKDQLQGYDVFKEGQYQATQETFKQTLSRANVDVRNVVIVPGKYQESLTKNIKEKYQIGKALVIHIDCDLYSSAKSAFSFISELIQDGTLILIDDFYCYRNRVQHGVQRAYREWIDSSNMVATHYLNYSWAGAAFIINKNNE